MSRTAVIDRKTTETHITIRLDLDGRGEQTITTGMPFLDHMLAQVARHGHFDLSVEATGDLAVDFHHTVEDLGIALGEAVSQALGDKAGIVRYGAARVPMDDALASVVMDLSGRPFLVFQAPQLKGGQNPHHMVEAVYKALGRALDQATGLDPRLSGVVPSTKGSLA